MTTTTEVAVYEGGDIDVTNPDNRAALVGELAGQVALIRETMESQLERGVHYGTIPGTRKPSLWQPGAEIIAQLFRFQTPMDRTDQHEDWEGLVFAYTYKCRLLNRHGELITEREATCSTLEKQYKSNPNPAEIRNTVKLMAQKRAYVAAVRAAAACSAIFTQDDDIVPAADSPRGAQAQPRADNGYGYCEQHGRPWFKRGGMKHPGHPMKDGEKWCNPPRDDAPEPEPPALTRPQRAESPELVAARDVAKAALDTLLGDDQQARADYVNQVYGLKGKHPSQMTVSDWTLLLGAVQADLDREATDAEPPEDAGAPPPPARAQKPPATVEDLPWDDPPPPDAGAQAALVDAPRKKGATH